MNRRLLLLLFTTFLITTAQERPEPAPGWYCSPKGERDHHCTCLRMDRDTQCEGIPQEDPLCRVYCHKSHCQCPVKCEPDQRAAAADGVRPTRETRTSVAALPSRQNGDRFVGIACRTAILVRSKSEHHN
jgi:hypothetical protein